MDGLTDDVAGVDCSVVILNYNGGAFLQQVVAAVLASRDVRPGVTVVDNGSTDGSADYLAGTPSAGREDRASPRIVLLRSGQNGGYASGNNLGLYGWNAPYIILLNNDAVVEPDTLHTLVRFMDRYQRVGACAPRLVWPNGRSQPFSHGDDPTPAYLLRRAVARRQGRTLHDWEAGAPRSVDWVAGTCLVLRASALSQVGMLDERIFMYFEDNDLCLRLRERGWRVYFVPEVAVRHYNRPAYDDRRRRANYYAGLRHFYARHYGWAAGQAVRIATGARQLLR